MYLSFYELIKKPFQISVDPSFLWMGEMHKEALAMLKYGILDNRGFVMLTGDVGTGKTTLVNALTDSLGPNVIIANITNPGLKRIEFINHLASAFGSRKSYTGKGQFLLDFALFLEKCYRDGKQVLLVVDEAQRLSQDMLEEIRLLSNIEHQNVKLLNIFFVGQDELNDILDLYENRALRQRMTLQYHLKPLSEKEIGQFIKHRLKVAGTERKIFTNKAINEIFAFSKGYPRLINIICDHAMLSGYVANKKVIDDSEVIECAKDLRLTKSSVTIKEAAPPPSEPNPDIKKLGEFPKPSLSFPIYVVGIFLIILMLCFLFFPTKSGFSFSNIFGKLSNTNNVSNDNISKQTEEYYPPAARLTFKVKDNDTESLNSFSSIQFERGNNLQISKSAINTETQATPPRQSTIEEVGLGYHPYFDQPDYFEEEQPIDEDASALGSQRIEKHKDENQEQLRGLGANDLPSQKTIPESERHYNISFEFDSNDITQEGFEQLNNTAEYMTNFPETRLTIKGHTDVSGADAYNVLLSKFRADIVKNYLVAKGIDSDRITSIGKGAEEPIADNDDYWGRIANRRVELEMTF